jgi:hypothetical protein
VAALVLAAGVGCSVTSGKRNDAHGIPHGDQVVVFFVAAAFSRGSSAPGLREAIRSLHQKLQAEAERQGLALEFVGVSLDWIVEDGIRFLRAYGPFDEMVVGGNWLNLAAIEYVWRDSPGVPTIPQIVLVRRRIDPGPSTIGVGPDHVVGRFVGVEQIIEWAGRSTHI